MVVSVENKVFGSVFVIGQFLKISLFFLDVIFMFVMVSFVNVFVFIDVMFLFLIVSLFKVSLLNIEVGKVVLGQLIMVIFIMLGKFENVLELKVKEEIFDLQDIVIEFGCLVLNLVVFENVEN